MADGAIAFGGVLGPALLMLGLMQASRAMAAGDLLRWVQSQLGHPG